MFTAAVPDAAAEPGLNTQPVSLTGYPPSRPAEIDRVADADRQERAHTAGNRNRTTGSNEIQQSFRRWSPFTEAMLSRGNEDEEPSVILNLLNFFGVNFRSRRWQGWGGDGRELHPTCIVKWQITFILGDNEINLHPFTASKPCLATHTFLTAQL